jgi:hypothetical protein
MLSTVLTIGAIIIVFFILFKIFSLLMRVLMIVVFLLLAYFTNPSIEQHVTAVQNKAEREDKKISLKRVEREDYKLFSLTKLAEGDEKKIIGAGAFTKVVVFAEL